jgi:hypothetical protein
MRWIIVKSLDGCLDVFHIGQHSETHAMEALSRLFDGKRSARGLLKKQHVMQRYGCEGGCASYHLACRTSSSRLQC